VFRRRLITNFKLCLVTLYLYQRCRKKHFHFRISPFLAFLNGIRLQTDYTCRIFKTMTAWNTRRAACCLLRSTVGQKAPNLYINLSIGLCTSGCPFLFLFLYISLILDKCSLFSCLCILYLPSISASSVSNSVLKCHYRKRYNTGFSDLKTGIFRY
jgi:hypothetical protein